MPSKIERECGRKWKHSWSTASRFQRAGTPSASSAFTSDAKYTLPSCAV